MKAIYFHYSAINTYRLICKLQAYAHHFNDIDAGVLPEGLFLRRQWPDYQAYRRAAGHRRAINRLSISAAMTSIDYVIVALGRRHLVNVFTFQ